MVRGKHAKPSETAKKVKKTSTAIAATFATGVMIATGTELASTAVASERPDSHVRFVDSQQESVAQQQSAGVPDVDSTLNPPAPSSTQEAQQAPVTSLQQEDASKGQVAQANQNMYEENPTVPLPQQIAASIPDDADVVGPDYAISADNSTVWRLDTGEQVTDPALVGTPDHPAVPFALSNGHRFLRVPVSRVREEMAQAGRSSQARVQTQVQHNRDGNSTDQAGQAAGQSSQSQQAENSSATSPNKGSVNTSAAHEADQSSSDGAVHGTFARAHIPGATLATSAGKYAGSTQATTFQGNEYGAHWGSDTGGAAFKDYQGRTMVYQARLFADISQWQGYPDWNQVKNSGIQGVIIRIGFGTGGIDTSAQYNIQQAKKHGIPFGVYLFSYAENGKEASAEGIHTVNLLRRYGVSPSDLALPVYYDLEWYHLPSSTYDSIANNWWSALQANGYKNLALYASTNWYNTYLNTPNLHAKAGWVAQYGALLQYRNFTSPSKFFGWQYSSKGRVAGIAGNVDLNAFGYTEPVSNPWLGQQGSDQAGVDITRYPQVSIPNGEYYINSAVNHTSSLDVPAGISRDAQHLQLWQSNQNNAQKYRFTRQSDGTYTIVNVASGKALDVAAARLRAGDNLQQYSYNGSRAQRWILRSAGRGSVYIQSALGNMVIDLAGGVTTNGRKVQLWIPNLNVAQKWELASSDVSVPSGMTKIQSVKAPNQVFDIPAANKNNGVQSQVWSWNKTKAQIWRFTSIGNGMYTIANLNSGKLLDARSGGTSDGTVVQQYQANGTDAQKWIVRNAGNGEVKFQNVLSGLFIDITSGNTANGTHLQLWQDNANPQQKFRILSVSQADIAPDVPDARSQMNALARQHQGDLRDGTYRVTASTNEQYTLDISAGSTSDHANIQLWSHNGTSAQEWNVSHDSQGYVTLTNVGTGKVLTVTGSAVAGRNVDQQSAYGELSENRYAQKWIAMSANRGIVFRSALDSAYSLDIDSNRMGVGTNIRLWQTNNTAGQAFHMLSPLVGTQRADIMAAAFRNAISDGAHRFASAANQRYMLDLAGGFRSDQTNIRLWENNGTSAQLWVVSHDSQGYVTLTNAGTGKALDVRYAVVANGENIWQFGKNNSRAQKWIAIQKGNSFVFHSALDPSYVIDVEASIMANGTNIRLWMDNGTAAQRWVG